MQTLNPMSDETMTSVMPEAALAASVALYRRLALRFTRTLTKPALGADLTEIFDREPLGEEEAQAEADAKTQRFEEIVRNRNAFDLSPFLNLGFDMIEDLTG